MKLFYTSISVALLGLLIAVNPSVMAEDDQDDSSPAALDFTMTSIDGKDIELSDYQGKVIVIVNVASECGFTPQYEDLQAIYERYQDKGLAILAFPCNQFGNQEPGTHEEIKQFCTERYQVTFDLFSKIDVKGEDQAPLYKYLTSLDVPPAGAAEIQWNFEKFLIGRDGKVIAHYGSRTNPSSKEFVGAIEKALDTESDGE